MGTRRWVLLGFNLLLATAILVQPTEASSGCDFDPCTCACLEEWDECDENGGEDCDAKYGKCTKKCKPMFW